MSEALVVTVLAGSLLVLLSTYLYIWHNDTALSNLPSEAAIFSPTRVTPEYARSAFADYTKAPLSVQDHLPFKTGRRYIVVGGTGFLGGWIVLHLLQRGEDPRSIRVLDVNSPLRTDLVNGRARDVQFFQVDISNRDAVNAAFNAPWPQTTAGEQPITVTVFHAAANIRFYERHEKLLTHSTRVIVDGTKHILDAARAIGVDTLIYTSSGAIALRRTRLWLWPWQKQPDLWVQAINDDDSLLPKRHEDFFSNYAAAKSVGERLVRAADGSPSSGGRILRTGCIRPGNGIFGPGGDILCGAYLVRKVNPTWVANILQSYCYVENCSLAHLIYERRLLELAAGGGNPDIGGQAFAVTDAGPPLTNGDIYTLMETLTDGETRFPKLPPTLMLLVSHIIEWYYLSRYFLLTSTSSAFRSLGAWMPSVGGDLINLQPSLHALVMVHLIFDSSRACLPAEKGGLGYHPLWTTVQGLCKTVDEYQKGCGRGEERSLGGGVGLAIASIFAQKRVKNAADAVEVSKISQLLN